MYSRSPNRSNRSRGIKVKHILQICLLVVVCFWLIYQVKHSHEKKKEFEEKDAKLASDTQSDGEILRLGRKDISRVTEVGRDDKINGEDDEENESDQAENRHEDDEQEREESKTEEREEEEDTSKGGEDDEIDRSEEEENHEEIVDEEKDREETDEKNEDNDVGEKEDNEESEAVLEDQDHEGGTKNTHEAREEQYKADDASSEVAHDTRSNLPETENATLKHTDRSSEQIIAGKENNVSQSSNQPLLDENSHEPVKGSNSSDSRVSESMEHKGNFTVSGYSTSENSTALMESSDQSQVSNSLTQLESEQSSKTTQAQNATSEDSHNEVSNATLISFSHVNTSDLASDKNPLDIKTVVNSTELGNTTSPELKFSLGENITRAAETTIDDGNLVNAGADDNPGNNSEDNVTGGEDESSDTDTANDNVGADLHDNVDDFASSLTQEEKEYRTDTGTLPDIKVEVQNADDMEAEE